MNLVPSQFKKWHARDADFFFFYYYYYAVFVRFYTDSNKESEFPERQ